MLGLLALAGMVSCIAVTVRCIHDLGLSGWFYLLILLPYIYGLVIFFFSLLPAQKHERKCGCNFPALCAGRLSSFYAKNFAMMAAPISVVPTSTLPWDMMSLVRRPLSSTAAIAASSLSASDTMFKE